MRFTRSIAASVVIAVMTIVVLLRSSQDTGDEAPPLPTPELSKPTRVVAMHLPPSSAMPTRQKSEGHGHRLADGTTNYGLFIQNAISTGSPQAAATALRYIARCEVASSLREVLERQRGHQQLNDARIARLIGDADNQLRLCQGVTSELLAHRQELGERALLGGVTGVAVLVGESIDFTPKEALKVPLRNALREDAARGDYAAVTRLALYGGQLGLSDVEASAYALLAQSVGDSEPQVALMRRGLQSRPPLVMNAEQQQAARLLADQLKSAWPQH